MDGWLGVEEVRQLENVSKRTIRWRVSKGIYTKTRRVKSTRGGRGGVEWQVHISSLSPQAQARYLEGLEGTQTNCPDQFLPGEPAEGKPEFRLEALSRYGKAPESAKEIAHSRSEIVQAWLRFKNKAPRGTSPAREFVECFRHKALSIDETIYKKVKRLSVPTLYRWSQYYERAGVAGLLPSTCFRASSLLLPVPVQNFIVTLIKDRPSVRAPRVAQFIRHRFGETVSTATVRRFMKKWKAENHELYAYLKNPEGWRHRYQLALGKEDDPAAYFCHIWEVDSTPADVICRDGKRYSCLVCVDVFSRRAHVVVSERSKATAIAALLRKAILDWGVPQVLVKDNGKDYSSKHIESVCTGLGIATPFIPPYTPEAKAIVERFIQTLAYSLFEELPGYCGHNVAERQEIRSRQKKLFCKELLTRGAAVKLDCTPQELSCWIDTWISRIYETKEHSALGCSPIEMAARSPKPVRKIEDPRVLDILLAPSGQAVVQTKGIQYRGGWYWAEQLIGHIREKVDIREDLSNAGQIYVFSPKGDYLCTVRDVSLEGLSVEDIVRSKKVQKRRLRAAARAIEELGSIEGNPMVLLLEDEARKAQVQPLLRKEALILHSVTEAEKAVQASLRAELELEQEEDPDPPDGIFYTEDYRARRYEWILKKMDRGEELSDQEEEFLNDYMQTNEWRLLFGPLENATVGGGR